MVRLEKINMPISIDYKTADNSAGSSLYKDCLWVIKFVFYWTTVSEYIWYLWILLTLRGAFFKAWRSHVFISRQIESQHLFLREDLHGLFCKLYTTQVSLNKMFCSRSLISKKSELINVIVEGYISRHDHRLNRERVKHLCWVFFYVVKEQLLRQFVLLFFLWLPWRKTRYTAWMRKESKL